MTYLLFDNGAPDEKLWREQTRKFSGMFSESDGAQMVQLFEETWREEEGELSSGLRGSWETLSWSCPGLILTCNELAFSRQCDEMPSPSLPPHPYLGLLF